jgi:magnesium chelatase family protein
MPLAEAHETICVHNIAGRTSACITTCPCRAPHHTISDVGVIGGGGRLSLQALR